MKIRYSVILLLSLFLPLTGCKKQQAADSGQLHTKLVVDLFKSIQDKDHKVTLNKVLRLRQLDKDNDYLAKLEEAIRFNITIEEIQKHLDQQNLPEAVKLIEQQQKIHGRNKRLKAVDNELRQLLKIQKLTNHLNHPQDSYDLAKNTFKLKKLAQSYKPAGALQQLINKRLSDAKVLHRRERQRARFYLAGDLINLKKTNSELAPLADAVLKLEQAGTSK